MSIRSRRHESRGGAIEAAVFARIKSARSNAIIFKLMNATKRVEAIVEMTHLQRVFEFCSVPELFCLLHRAASIPSCSADQSTRADENESRNSFVEWPQAVPAA